MAILWDIRHCARQTRLEGHHGGVFGVDLDQGALTAYTASGDKTIRQWEVSTGVCLRMTRPSRDHPVMALHWDQGYLAACAGDVITLWDGESLERVREFKGHEDRVESVQLTVYSDDPVHGVMLSASQDRTIKYWDLKSGRCVRTLRGHQHKLSSAVADEIRVISADEGSLRVWDFHPHRAGAGR